MSDDFVCEECGREILPQDFVDAADQWETKHLFLCADKCPHCGNLFPTARTMALRASSRFPGSSIWYRDAAYVVSTIRPLGAFWTILTEDSDA